MTTLEAVNGSRAIRERLDARWPTMTHPGDDQTLRTLISSLHAFYISNTAKPTLSEFVDRYRLANCDIAAIAAAQKATPKDELLIAMGSSPGRTGSNKKFADFACVEHAWNLAHQGEDPRSFVSMDMTPRTLTAGGDVNKMVVEAVLPSISEIRNRYGKVNGLPVPPSPNHEMVMAFEHILKNKQVALYPVAHHLVAQIRSAGELFPALDAYSTPEFSHLEPEARGAGLCEAIKRADLAEVQRIYTSGKPFTIVGSAAANALGGAMFVLAGSRKAKRFEVLSYLVNVQKVAVGSLNEYGSSVLMSAVFSGNFDSARHLLSLGADINQVTPEQGTLAQAVTQRWEEGDYARLEFLKSNGADFQVGRATGESPLQLVTKRLEASRAARKSWDASLYGAYNEEWLAKYEVFAAFVATL